MVDFHTVPFLLNFNSLPQWLKDFVPAISAATTNILILLLPDSGLISTVTSPEPWPVKTVWETKGWAGM